MHLPVYPSIPDSPHRSLSVIEWFTQDREWISYIMYPGIVFAQALIELGQTRSMMDPVAFLIVAALLYIYHPNAYQTG